MIGFPNWYNPDEGKVDRRREYGCAAGCVILILAMYLFVGWYHGEARMRATLRAGHLYSLLQAGDFQSPEVKSLAREGLLAKFKEADQKRGRVESFRVIFGGAQITGMPGYAYVKVKRRGKETIEEVESVKNQIFDSVGFDATAP